VLKQVAQHVGPQAVAAFDHFTRLLKRLANTDFAEHFEQRPLGCCDLRRTVDVLAAAPLVSATTLAGAWAWR